VKRRRETSGEAYSPFLWVPVAWDPKAAAKKVRTAVNSASRYAEKIKVENQ
jgi:hypothetical protein